MHVGSHVSANESIPTTLTSSSDPATRKVLENTYLVEMILLAMFKNGQLQDDKLIKSCLVLQRVCRLFHETIIKSIHLRRFLYLEPSPPVQCVCVCGGGPRRYAKFVQTEAECSTAINPVFQHIMSGRNEPESRCARWLMGQQTIYMEAWMQQNFYSWSAAQDEVGVESVLDLDQADVEAGVPPLPEMSERSDQVEHVETLSEAELSAMMTGQWPDEDDDDAADDYDFDGPDPDEDYDISGMLADVGCTPIKSPCIPLLSFHIRRNESFHRFGLQNKQTRHDQSWRNMALTKPALRNVVFVVDKGVTLGVECGENGVSLGWLWSKLDELIRESDNGGEIVVNFLDWANETRPWCSK